MGIGGDQTEQAEPADYVVATYEETRLRFGLGGTDQARIKAKSRKWPAEPQNHPGAIARIRVPRDAWDAVPAETEGVRSWGSAPDHSQGIKALADAPAAFREEQEQASDREERLVAEVQKAREVATTAMLEAAAERLKAAVAETEAKGLREQLAEARRPFWRRWIG